MNLNTMLIGNQLVDMDQVKRMSVDTRDGDVVYTITDYDGRVDEIRVMRDFHGSVNEKAAKNMNNTYKEVMERVVSGDVFADEVKEVLHTYTAKELVAAIAN